MKGKAAAKSMPKAGRNPKGGLTAKGRDYFNKTEGSHLQAGVTGAADTPEKMHRKGSFLVRFFSHPRGPMLNPRGEPTRLALSAHAWGEPIPKTMSAAHKLAAKGHTLLAKYHAAQEKTVEQTQPKKAAKTSARRPTRSHPGSKNRQARGMHGASE